MQSFSKNKFEILAHLVGFIIRIYHDALSPELQISVFIYCVIANRGCCKTYRSAQPQKALIIHTVAVWAMT